MADVKEDYELKRIKKRIWRTLNNSVFDKMIYF